MQQQQDPAGPLPGAAAATGGQVEAQANQANQAGYPTPAQEEKKKKTKPNRPADLRIVATNMTKSMHRYIRAIREDPNGPAIARAAARRRRAAACRQRHEPNHHQQAGRKRRSASSDPPQLLLHQQEQQQQQHKHQGNSNGGGSSDTDTQTPQRQKTTSHPLAHNNTKADSHTSPTAAAAAAASANANDSVAAGAAALQTQRHEKAVPLCAGWLRFQTRTGVWEKFWCEFYSDCSLYYRREGVPNSTQRRRLRILYCSIECDPPPVPTGDVVQPSPSPSKVRQKNRHVEANDNAAATAAASATGLGTKVTDQKYSVSRNEETFSLNKGATGGFLRDRSVLYRNRVFSVLDNFGQTYWMTIDPASYAWDAYEADEAAVQEAVHQDAAMMLAAVDNNNRPIPSGAEIDPAMRWPMEDRSGQRPPVPQPRAVFRLCTPDLVVLVCSDKPKKRCDLLRIMKHHIDLTFPFAPSVIRSKATAMNHILPVLREQFMMENMCHRVIKAMGTERLRNFEKDVPITSPYKTKNGMLAVSTRCSLPDSYRQGESTDKGADSDVDGGWRDFYLVLYGGFLFFYKDSKSSIATGVLCLKYAAIAFDASELSTGNCVVHIITPCRTVICKARHAVSLSEWVVCIEHEILSINSAPSGKNRAGASAKRVKQLKQKRKQSMLVKRSSRQVLEAINGLLADISTFKSLLLHPIGLKSFREFLSSGNVHDCSTADVDCYLEIDEFVSKVWTVPAAELRYIARNIFFKYLSGNVGQMQLSQPPPAQIQSLELDGDATSGGGAFGLTVKLPVDVVLSVQKTLTMMPHVPSSSVGGSDINGGSGAELGGVRVAAPHIDESLFAGVRKHILIRLARAFETFKSGPLFAQLTQKLSDGHSRGLCEGVGQFPSKMELSFLIKIKGKRQSLRYVFPQTETIFTIGREKSNGLVMDDSRVSRAHARIQYSESHCEFIDLGSSCGSRKNGRTILRSKLEDGDVIEMGQSMLIFRVQPGTPVPLMTRLLRAVSRGVTRK